VTNVAERAGPGSGWTVTWRGGASEHQGDFDLVVVCIGLYSHLPHRPAFPAQESFTGEIMHVSGLRSRDQIAGKRVCVLGFGKSATDAALEAAEVAAETHIVFREPHWPVPPVLAGILPFKWAMLNRLASTLIPPYQHPTGVERAVHSLGKPLVWFYWRLVELLLYGQCRLGSRFGTRVSLVPKARVEVDAFGESTMLPKPEFYRAVRRGAIDAQRTEVAAYTPNGVVLKNGRSLEIDTMVLATGWKTDFGFLATEVWNRLGAEDDGFYLYRHMLHPETPGLVFVGRAATVCSILTYSLQARWLGELLAGGFDLPPRDEMRREIDAMRAWKRSWMPFSRARSARLIVHMQHYHDELLRDFGAATLRKRGILAPLAELIAPYEPADYEAIVSGDWKRHEARTGNA
jgi:dimethylaniline monooxygenase (N-oxide forming)